MFRALFVFRCTQEYIRYGAVSLITALRRRTQAHHFLQENGNMPRIVTMEAMHFSCLYSYCYPLFQCTHTQRASQNNYLSSGLNF
jgi:hypothetical protein